eukprot:1049114_1
MDRMSLLYAMMMTMICKGYPSSRSDQIGDAIGNSGLWGSWSSAIYCNDGYFATGFKFKVEGGQGLGDDTAANSFRMVCDDGNTVTADREGGWGSWSSTVSCPDGSYITGIRDKFEGDQGSLKDDSAMNSVSVSCTDGSEITASNGEGSGNWDDYSDCPDATSACGFKQRVEGNQGSTVDDTALNAVQLYCCENAEEEEEGSNTYDFDDIYGYWNLISICGGGGVCTETRTIAITNLESSEVTTEFATSFTAAASATFGYTPPAPSGGGHASVTLELSTTASTAVAQSTIKSISEFISTSSTFQCGTEDDAMYQWVTVSTVTVTYPSGDTNEVDVELDSKYIWCVSESTMEPQCPPGYCVDEDCQECDLYSDDQTIVYDAEDEPSSRPTAKPTSESYQGYDYGDSTEDEDTANSNTAETIVIIVLLVLLCIVLTIIYCMYKCCVNCCKNSAETKQPNKQTPAPVVSTTTTAPVAMYPITQAAPMRTPQQVLYRTGEQVMPMQAAPTPIYPYQTAVPNTFTPNVRVVVVPTNVNTVPRV